MIKITLASASPRRRELLNQIGLKFRVVASDIEEPMGDIENAEEAVKTLALKKARLVAEKVKEGLVIAADTIVVYKGKIFGKPKDTNEAREMLEKLSGRTHDVITGLVAMNAKTGEKIVECVRTKVKMRKLTSEEIGGYIATREPFDKAGAYAIQGKGALLVEKINGCYYNVVGLPLPKLSEMLAKFGVNLLKT